MRKNWEIEWDQLDGPEYAAYFDAQFGEATKTRSGSHQSLVPCNGFE